MDTNRIRYFLSLVKTASVTKAAQLHHISAPALSKAIKVLESELNEKLIIPSGRGIQLTDKALSIAPLLEEIMLKLSAVCEQSEWPTRESDQARRPLKIATFEVFSTHFMEHVLSGTFRDRPCMIYEMAPGLMEQAVAQKEADLALTYIPIPHPDLDHLRIKNVAMGIYGVVQKFNDFSERETPFVIPITPLQGSPNKVRGLDGWPDDAFPRRVLYRVGMLETALGICRRGLAVAYIPKFIARLHNEVVKSKFHLEEKPLPLKFPHKKEYIYLVKRKTDLEDQISKKLGAAIRSLCD